MDINIKRQTQLGPATIVRCGHTGFRQSFQSFHGTALGAAFGAASWISTSFPSVCWEDTEHFHSWLMWWLMDTLARKAASVLTDLGQEWLWGRECCLFYISCIGQFWVQKNLSRKLQWNIHTMQSPYYRGNRQHMQDGGERATMNECKLFTVFLTAFDPNTSVSLTTTSHKRFIVSWACRSLGVKWKLHFIAILRQRVQRQCSLFSNQWIERLLL